MASISEIIQKHAEADEERFEEIQEMFSTIKENHLAHMQTALEKLATDVQWIKWFLGSVILALLYIIIK